MNIVRSRKLRSCRAPDPLRLSVPKAFVVLAAGEVGDSETARSILEHVRGRVAPFKRIRRIEFAELPKTISGKIRRVELRRAEAEKTLGTARRSRRYWEEDLAIAPPGTRAAKSE